MFNPGIPGLSIGSIPNPGIGKYAPGLQTLIVLLYNGLKLTKLYKGIYKI